MATSLPSGESLVSFTDHVRLRMCVDDTSKLVMRNEALCVPLAGPFAIDLRVGAPSQFIDSFESNLRVTVISRMTGTPHAALRLDLYQQPVGVVWVGDPPVQNEGSQTIVIPVLCIVDTETGLAPLPEYRFVISKIAGAAAGRVDGLLFLNMEFINQGNVLFAITTSDFRLVSEATFRRYHALASAPVTGPGPAAASLPPLPRLNSALHELPALVGDGGAMMELAQNRHAMHESRTAAPEQSRTGLNISEEAAAVVERKKEVNAELPDAKRQRIMEEDGNDMAFLYSRQSYGLGKSMMPYMLMGGSGGGQDNMQHMLPMLARTSMLCQEMVTMRTFFHLAMRHDPSFIEVLRKSNVFICDDGCGGGLLSVVPPGYADAYALCVASGSTGGSHYVELRDRPVLTYNPGRGTWKGKMLPFVVNVAESDVILTVTSVDDGKLMLLRETDGEDSLPDMAMVPLLLSGGEDKEPVCPWPSGDTQRDMRKQEESRISVTTGCLRALQSVMGDTPMETLSIKLIDGELFYNEMELVAHLASVSSGGVGVGFLRAATSWSRIDEVGQVIETPSWGDNCMPGTYSRCIDFCSFGFRKAAVFLTFKYVTQGFASDANEGLLGALVVRGMDEYDERIGLIEEVKEVAHVLGIDSLYYVLMGSTKLVVPRTYLCTVPRHQTDLAVPTIVRGDPPTFTTPLMNVVEVHLGEFSMAGSINFTVAGAPDSEDNLVFVDHEEKNLFKFAMQQYIGLMQNRSQEIRLLHMERPRSHLTLRCNMAWGKGGPLFLLANEVITEYTRHTMELHPSFGRPPAGGLHPIWVVGFAQHWLWFTEILALLSISQLYYPTAEWLANGEAYFRERFSDHTASLLLLDMRLSDAKLPDGTHCGRTFVRAMMTLRFGRSSAGGLLEYVALMVHARDQTTAPLPTDDHEHCTSWLVSQAVLLAQINRQVHFLEFASVPAILITQAVGHRLRAKPRFVDGVLRGEHVFVEEMRRAQMDSSDFKGMMFWGWQLPRCDEDPGMLLVALQLMFATQQNLLMDMVEPGCWYRGIFIE